MAWPAHSAEFGLIEVLRAIEEMRAEQKAELLTLANKLDAMQRAQASGQRQLLSRLEGGVGAPQEQHEASPRQVFTTIASPPSGAPKQPLSPSGVPKTQRKHRNHTKEMQALRAETDILLQPKTQVILHKGEREEPDPIKRLGNAAWFKFLCSFIIMISIIFVAMETNETASYALGVDLCIGSRGPAPVQLDLTMYTYLEYIFLTWMSLELCVNLRTTGALFSGPDWKWNIFDMTILSASFFQMLMDSLSGMAALTRSLRLGRLMKFLRVMRLAKVMKVLRVFRHLHGVRKMILSMVGSVSTLFWALFLMFFLTFLAGVIMLQGVEMHYKAIADERDELGQLGNCSPGGTGNWDGSPSASEKLPMFNVDPLEDSLTEQVHKLYSSVQATMLTLFGAISGGSEWPVVADPLARISPMFTVIWIIFVCLMIFGVLNILTGIFCEAAMQAAASDRVAILMKQREEMEYASEVLRHSFNTIDDDHSGMLTKEEFLQLLSDEEVVAMCMHIGLDTSEAGALFNLLDDDQSGTIHFEEFLQGCLGMKGDAKKMDVIQLSIMNRRLMKGTVVLMEMVDEMWNSLEDLHKEKHYDC